MNLLNIRNAVAQRLQLLGVPVNPNLPLLDPPATRDAVAVAQCLMVEYALTGLAHGANRRKLYSWLEEQNLVKLLTPQDRDFFQRKLSPQEEIDLSWRQERLISLAWSGRVITELTYPPDDSLLDSIFPLIPPEVDTESFTKAFQLRPVEQLAYEADFYYCLHSAYRHPELWSIQQAKILPIDAIRERRTALEWVNNRELNINDVALDT
jgi:hypothetical protein